MEKFDWPDYQTELVEWRKVSESWIWLNLSAGACCFLFVSLFVFHKYPVAYTSAAKAWIGSCFFSLFFCQRTGFGLKFQIKSPLAFQSSGCEALDFLTRLLLWNICKNRIACSNSPYPIIHTPTEPPYRISQTPMTPQQPTLTIKNEKIKAMLHPVALWHCICFWFPGYLQM